MTPRLLLTLGFIRTGAFPAVGLPLLVETADADSLPPADGDVLLHETGQHACRDRGSTAAVIKCCGWPPRAREGAGIADARARPSLSHPKPTQLPTAEPEPHALFPHLTFLRQHGDEGTDELIIVVGSPLVINLQTERRFIRNYRWGREKGELTGLRTGVVPGPAPG